MKISLKQSFSENSYNYGYSEQQWLTVIIIKTKNKNSVLWRFSRSSSSSYNYGHSEQQWPTVIIIFFGKAISNTLIKLEEEKKICCSRRALRLTTRTKIRRHNPWPIHKPDWLPLQVAARPWSAFQAMAMQKRKVLHLEVSQYSLKSSYSWSRPASQQFGR